eukprot:gene23030-29219_t
MSGSQPTPQTQIQTVTATTNSQSFQSKSDGEAEEGDSDVEIDLVSNIAVTKKMSALEVTTSGGGRNKLNQGSGEYNLAGGVFNLGGMIPMKQANKVLYQAGEAILFVKDAAVSQVTQYMASNLYICSFIGCVNESLYYVSDRVSTATELYLNALTSDDPERRHLGRIKNSVKWQNILLRYSMASLTWKQRQLLEETRDGGTLDQMDLNSLMKESMTQRGVNLRNPRTGDKTRLMRIADEYFYITTAQDSGHSHGHHEKEKATIKQASDKALESYQRAVADINTKNTSIPSITPMEPDLLVHKHKASHVHSTNPNGHSEAVDLLGGDPTKSTVAMEFIQSNIHAWLENEAADGDDDAQYALAKFFTAPVFSEHSQCYVCTKTFGITLFRHHCRFCGQSVCEDHSKDRRCIFRFGLVQPVRVCGRCRVNIDEIHRRDTLIWKESRVQAYLSGRLIPYFNPTVDRGIDKALRIADYSLIVAKNTLALNFPTKIVIETIDILKRYGLSGFAGLLLRADFLESVETLKRISGMDAMFRLSLHELTACIYYKLAIDRGLRGCNPEGERIAHAPHVSSSSQQSGSQHGVHSINSSAYGAPKSSTPIPVGDDEADFECDAAKSEDIDRAIRFAPLALKIVYEVNPVDCQRLARSQGWEMVFSNAETKLEPEQPCYALFANELPNRMHQTSPENSSYTSSIHHTPPASTGVKSININSRAAHAQRSGIPTKQAKQIMRKEAVLAIRGTKTIQDVVTDIRAAPQEFPPSNEDINGALNGDCFSRAAMNVLREVGPSLVALYREGYEITIVGHSLGGGVAALLTYLLKTSIPSVQCIAYGCPSCVDAVTADVLRGHVLSVINHDDVISRITPQSIRALMSELMLFREQVFRHMAQDWTDVMARAYSLWSPRWRQTHSSSNYQSQQESDLSGGGGSSANAFKALHHKVLKDSPSPHPLNNTNTTSDDMVLIEEEVLPSLWVPGRIVHVYLHKGQYHASEVSRTFPDIRKIEVQGNMFEDHRSKNILDALLEVRAVRHAANSPPDWIPFNLADVCYCCSNSFTWHSTFRGAAQEYRDRYNCKHCGNVVCGPCSTHRRAIPKYGLFFPERICDHCLYKGDFAIEAEQKANLEKLRREKTNHAKRMKNIEDSLVKFPMKDELLFNPAYVKGKPRKTLPIPSSSVDQYISADLASDAVFVWDFLNVFNKQLSLSSVSFEDFADLLKYTGRDSVALNDVYLSVLKLVVSDTAILNKLNNAIPRKVHFAYRLVPVVEGVTQSAAAQDVDDELNLEQLSNLDSFDNLYNGFKLLPRKIRVEHVDVIRYQAVLRCVLLRLEPVKRLRSAVVDITNALQTSLFNSNSILNSTVKRLNTVKSLDNGSNSNKTSRNNSVNNLTRFDTETSTTSNGSQSLLPPKTPMNVKFSNLLHRIDSTTSVRSKASSSTAAKKVSEISSAAMARVNTPRKANSLKTAGLDKDAVFRISGDVTAPLETIVEAAIELETKEMYELSAKHKLAVLKVLCEACYDTVRITELLERNAEERATQIAAQNKQIKEAKLKLRELSVGKKAQAIDICKKANKAAIEAANAAALATLGVTSSKSRKSLSKTASTTSLNGTADGEANTSTAVVPAVPAPKKKGGPMAKELYEPSAEQVNAMIDDLMLIETLGIDEVVDDFLPEVISEDEEETEDGTTENNNEEEDDFEMVDGDTIRLKRPQRRNMAQKRAFGGEKKRAREEKRYRNETLAIADYRLTAAFERNSERDIRAAVKHGEKSGLRYSDKKGRVFCTQKMKQAYKLLADMETKTAEDRAASQHERALGEYFVRTTPIGSDRFHNTYWSFIGDERLFVQQREEIPEKERTGLIPPTSGPHHDKTLSHLFSSRPNRYSTKWVVYASVTEFWHLWDALDERGEREAELKAAIKARFDFEEPATVYMQLGSEYIGRKVNRTFTVGKKRSVIGTIVGWLPQSGEDIELYHVVHADGDEEDLELHEVQEYLVKEEVKPSVTSNASLLSPVRGGGEVVPGSLSRSGSRSSLRNGLSASLTEGASTPTKSSLSSAINGEGKVKKSGDDEEEFDGDEGEGDDQDEEPNIIAKSSGIARGSANRFHIIGVPGLRADLNKTLCDMSEVLKRLGGMFPREERKVWESSVRNADSVLELKAPLLELEALVRAVQKTEDKRDVEELRLQREKKYAEMRDEGWIFEQTAPPGSTRTSRSDLTAADTTTPAPDYSAQTALIGSNSRRFFKGFGKSDGKIVAFLPAEKNEGLSLFHMEHTDGDVEDLDEIDVERGVRYFAQGYEEEPQEGEGGGAEGEDEEEDSSDDEGDEDEEESEDEYAPVANVSNGIYSVTLWPTYEIRTRWRDCVNNIRTVGELALALTAFIEQARLFGVIVPDEEEVRAATARSSKLRAVSSSSSSRGGSSSNNRNGSSSSSEVLGKRNRTASSSRNQHFSPEKRTRLQRSSTRKRINYNEDY